LGAKLEHNLLCWNFVEKEEEGGDIYPRVSTWSVYLCRKKQDHVGDLIGLHKF